MLSCGGDSYVCGWVVDVDVVCVSECSRKDVVVVMLTVAMNINLTSTLHSQNFVGSPVFFFFYYYSYLISQLLVNILMGVVILQLSEYRCPAA